MALQLVQTVTVGSGGAASIEFTNIPQTGKDLLVLTSLRGTSGANARILPNNNSSNHTWLRLFGTGNSVGSSGPNANASNLQDVPNDPSYTANTFSNNSIYISNYTVAAAKSISVDSVQENNATSAFQVIQGITWNNTAAITSLVLQLDSNNFVQHSTASLYLVTGPEIGGLATPKATGGTISFTGTHWVHTFNASGTFTPTQNLTDVEYVVVAGGGGGDGSYNENQSATAGGGGAGGYRSSVVGENSGGGASAESRLSLTSGVGYTVTVGAGGSRGGPTFNVTNGSNSSFGSITSTGGGRSNSGGEPFSGGSGAGAISSTNSGTRTGAAGTANQGYAGGNGTSTTLQGSAGGGGAGAAGSNPTNANGANGGNGVASSITGTSVTRGGGGGGGRGNGGTQNGQGGSGGGASGGENSGTANTGGGGGGAAHGSPGPNGGNGGSGVVIVRYAA